MSRNLTSDMATDFSSNQVNPVLLAEALFDSGPLRLWTGYGDLIWDDLTFSGAGNFLGISEISETQDLEAKNLIVSLNGVPSDLVALALLESPTLRRRPFRLYLGSVSSTRRIATEDEPGAILLEDGGYILLENVLTDSPYRLFSGLMDHFEIEMSGDESTIRLAVENILITGQRTKVSRYTHEEQQRLYPGDMGLEFINQLQDKEVVW